MANKPLRPKRKIDPQFVAKARELRDRYLEHVNREGSEQLASGKYDVTPASDARTVRQLDAA